MLSPSRERQRRRVFAQRKPVLSNNAVEATLTRQWPIRTNVATQPSALGYLILTVEYYVARSLASPCQVSKPTAFCQAGNLCGHPLSKCLGQLCQKWQQVSSWQQHWSLKEGCTNENPEKMWSFAKPPSAPPPVWHFFKKKIYPHFFCWKLHL